MSEVGPPSFSGFSLRGRRALVTGSSEGIGEAVVRLLAKAGAEVIVHGLAHGADGASVATDIKADGGHACFIPADLSDAVEIKQLLGQAGDLDILVSNVAVQHRRRFAQISRDEMDEQFNLNIKALVDLVQNVLPGMMERGWGRIVTMGSVQEQVPSPQMHIYAGLKSAQENIVRNLAREVAASGVTVNNIAPGVIMTARSEPALSDPEYASQFLQRIPAARFGTPEDVAAAALLFCSPAGSYITGTTIAVDGGLAI